MSDARIRPVSAETKAAPPLPTSAHWLGDRHDAEKTGHATDMRGCVLYFDRQSDCLQFMRWLEQQCVSREQPSEGER